MKPFRSARGFSLADTVTAMAIGVTMTAVAVPVASRALEDMRISDGTRKIERELQTARLKAVSANRPMMLRFNCPAVGQFRMVEITGVAATDQAGNRCDSSAYPYPGPKDTDRATPQYDGPVRVVHPSLSVSGGNIVFTPKGMAMTMVNNTLHPINGTTSVTITKGSRTYQVGINALGKIALN